MNEGGPLDIFAQIRAGEEAVLRQGLATTDKHRSHGESGDFPRINRAIILDAAHPATHRPKNSLRDFRMGPPRAVLAIATEYNLYGYTVVHAMHCVLDDAEAPEWGAVSAQTPRIGLGDKALRAFERVVKHKI
ncbi:hypothetical protein FB451DRAFT_1385769 [Mycena latifolia]|nr:hypothetical protein FB451DRAFT_1385769 [Mycena latifolia]